MDPAITPPIADTAAQEDWPLRRWLLAVLGAVAAFVIYSLLQTRGLPLAEASTRLAAATFIAISTTAFGFTVERGKIAGSALFSVIAGAVVAAVLYYTGNRFADQQLWRGFSALLTVTIAVPLFQGWRDGGMQRWHIPYTAAHNRAWMAFCLWHAAGLFVLATFLLSWLLAMLFSLIGIDIIKDLLLKQWFWMTLTGTAFGGAIGLLRDREKIVLLVQRVVMVVLSTLAPVLAAGLVLFLCALPFTGLHALWKTASSTTTPIMLSCIVGALILANAIIGDKDEDESRMPILRISAIALGAALLPLALIAAISTGLRIGQYGLTPSRLWAATFCAIALVYGLAYIWSLARGRAAGWSGFVRPLNMKLAVGLCILALLLSTPFINFGALSARNQVARLQSGAVTAEKFDWSALRFDFGPSGQEALRHLGKEGKTPEIRRLAHMHLASRNRYAGYQQQKKQKIINNIVIIPAGAVLPFTLREKLTDYDACANADPCNIYYRAEAQEAMIVRPARTIVLKPNDKGKWARASTIPRAISAEEISQFHAAFRQGKVEIRPVTRRQIFVNGQPIGDSFE